VLSAWQLCRKRPELAGAFRIPWGKLGLGYAVIAPLALSAFALVVPAFSDAPADRFTLRWGPVSLLVGPLAYWVIRRFDFGKRNQLIQSSTL
jgi:hypothetical protein